MQDWRNLLAYPKEAKKVQPSIQQTLDTLDMILPLPVLVFPDRYSLLGIWLDTAGQEGLLSAEELWSIRSALAPLL